MPAPAVSPIITALTCVRATATDQPLTPSTLSSSLAAALAAVPDPRRAQGRRHTLRSMLALVICAVLAGADNYSQIAAWIHDSDEHTRTAVGAGAVMVSESALRKTLQRLDADALDAATCAWINSRERAATTARERNRRLRVLALDGKTLRGSANRASPRTSTRTSTRTASCEQTGRHLLAVFDTSTGTVAAQVDVDAKTNEITRFATVLDAVNLTGDLTGYLTGGLAGRLAGAVVTADALHAQRAHATYLHDRGGHYLLTVKRNQPTLHEQLSKLPFNASPVQASSLDRDHGRTEERHVKALELPASLIDQLGFAGAAQAVRVVRRRTLHSSGATSIEIVYAITSLSPLQAGVHDLAAIARAHWQIENRLHHVRDVTFAEDACRVRTGSGPRVLAGFRNLALGVLRLAGESNIAAARARLARRPDRPIRLLQGM